MGDIKPEKTNYLSLDLEFNQPSQKIIEVGAVVGNIKTGQILEELSCFIKIDELLNPRIIKLTSITDKELQENGVTLEEAYDKLKDLHTRHNCFKNSVCWGGGDSQALRKTLGLDEEKFLLGRRWIDIKTVFQMWRLSQNEKMQGGLARSLTKMGLAFKGKKHRAVDDARNTFLIAAELLKKFKE